MAQRVARLLEAGNLARAAVVAVSHTASPRLVCAGGICVTGGAGVGPARKAAAGVAEYAELCVTSNFTFLTGASHPEELVTRAADLGLAAIAITDRNSLAGVVRAHVALRELARMRAEAVDAQIKVRSQIQMDSCSRQDMAMAPALAVEPTLMPLPRLIIGVRLVLMDSAVQWLALPTDRAAYARLSRLLSLGKGRAPKGECHLRQADVMDHATGMILIALPQGAGSAADTADLLRLTRRFAGMVYLGAAPRYDGQDQPRFDALAGLSQRTGLPMVALGDVLMHHGSRRRLADVLTCLRQGLTVDRIGKHALPNAERRLKSPTDMARLFQRFPAAIKRSVEIADRCGFSLAELSYEYPDEITDGEAAQDRLARITDIGLAKRFPAGVPDATRAKVVKELRI
ncbi:MAG: PHP domain-containing protein, partial [Rhodoferax sp.]|nr:PHP domain-containing protein [Pseudorhodobacter sp.]